MKEKIKVLLVGLGSEIGSTLISILNSKKDNLEIKGILTNQIFKNAQTPSCYFLLTKAKSPNTITIYDEDRNKYINYYLTEKAPIPVFGQEIIKKLRCCQLQKKHLIGP